MQTKPRKRRFGFTIIEVMVAVAVLMICIIGASAFRYNSMLDVRKAEMEFNGARLSLLLLETWRGTGGALDFDPVDHLGSDIEIESSSTDLVIDDFTEYSAYSIESEKKGYEAALFYRDVDTGLRALSVTVSWQIAADEDQAIMDSVELTTYVFSVP